MGGSRHRRRRLLALAALGLSLGLARCATDDEVHCEEAAARLAKCCPGFDPRGLDCVSGPPCHSPKILAEDARCIEDTSCDALVAGGTCARASYLAGSGPSVPTPYPVCR